MRLLHTMIRVGDLDRSIGFYTDVLGMKLLRRKDYPDGKFTLAFVGYGGEDDHTVIELTPGRGLASLPLNLGVLLDVSHSMLGKKLDTAKRACQLLLDGLGAQDRAAVCIFLPELLAFSFWLLAFSG